MDGDEIKLAKALANPDAEIRHKTAKQLHLYLRSIPADPQSSDDEKAMMRLWKALYYCLWLADKVPTQNDISQCFADGLLITSAPQAYLRAFARTIIREWTNLDQYRVEKFYVLIRVMVRAVLSLLHSLKWTPTQCEGILQVLYSEMLNKVPNGPRLHVSDLYLTELVTAVDDDKNQISTKALLLCIQPFLTLLTTTTDKAVIARVSTNVFQGVLTLFQLSGDDDSSPRHRKMIETVQFHLFETASQEDIKEVNRVALYALHREFQKVTQKMHIESSVGNDDVSESEEPVKKKQKSTKKGTSEVVETKVVAEKKSDIVTSRGQEVEVKSKEVSNKVAISQGTQGTKKGEVKPKAIETILEAKAVKEAKPLVAAAVSESVVPAVQADFVACPKYTGTRPGFVFKKDSKGLGYYRDKVALSTTAKSVRFGQSKAKGYIDSVNSLKTSPLDLSSKPTKGVLKPNSDIAAGKRKR